MSIIPQNSMQHAECRICFDTFSTRENPLMSPCLCNGTSKYVHKECIQEWRHANLNTTAFTHCRECTYAYNIKPSKKEETFYISVSFIENLKKFQNLALFNCLIFFASFSFRSLDKYTKYPSVLIITNFEKPSNELINFFETHEIFNIQYIYCSFIFCLSIISFISYFLKINIYIKRRIYFWKYFLLPYLFNFFFSLHLYFYGRLSNQEIIIVDSLLTLETMASFLNPLLFICLFKIHNKIIKIMNQNIISDILNIDNTTEHIIDP